MFGGKYMTDCTDEFPADWFVGARLCSERHDPRLTISASTRRSRSPSGDGTGGSTSRIHAAGFSVTARIMGRRSADDVRQIRRWRAIARHVTAIRKNCEPGDLECRRRQRQAVLHWAYDSRKI